MRLSYLEGVNTTEELQNRLQLANSLAEEERKSYDDMLYVDDEVFGHSRYVVTTSKNGIIHTNFFQYSNKNKHGICYMKPDEAVLHNYINPEYVQLALIHNNLWIGAKSDATYELLAKGSPVLEGVSSYDVLALNGLVIFLQLDTPTNRYLVCADNTDLNDGLFSPKDKDDFLQYFESVVRSNAYEGRLDNMRISGIYKIEFEVINTIFSLRPYKQVIL